MLFRFCSWLLYLVHFLLRLRLGADGLGLLHRVGHKHLLFLLDEVDLLVDEAPFEVLALLLQIELNPLVALSHRFERFGTHRRHHRSRRRLGVMFDRLPVGYADHMHLRQGIQTGHPLRMELDRTPVGHDPLLNFDIFGRDLESVVFGLMVVNTVIVTNHFVFQDALDAFVWKMLERFGQAVEDIVTRRHRLESYTFGHCTTGCGFLRPEIQTLMVKNTIAVDIIRYRMIQKHRRNFFLRTLLL